MSPSARALANLAGAFAAFVDGFTAALSCLGVETAQRRAARRQGQVVCWFPHDALDPAHRGGPRAACPECGAAL
ncbi:hypothetical protein DER29_0498 [Micromonospora sp. M71_S20]|uniref:hypothetical protein n=1 Tax=Micromonospora sp. M71_S20 TaxID=592872 RepID=UPI000EAFC5C3|nr:hypothetical protein [Micromonospora sp. M71_S20]RLK22660.1 hypothetical protein DER29_0498 [Micromonospora sp. M71_S20]